MSLRDMRVVVVDDGSDVPIQLEDFANARCEVVVIRHPVSRGAAAAATGLAASTMDFVAFLDSDVVPHPGLDGSPAGPFRDPAVALVAPRIVGLGRSEELVARYEAVRSSLDLGDRGFRSSRTVRCRTCRVPPSSAGVQRCWR